jgi:hypothetical protein
LDVDDAMDDVVDAATDVAALLKNPEKARTYGYPYSVLQLVGIIQQVRASSHVCAVLRAEAKKVLGPG